MLISPKRRVSGPPGSALAKVKATPPSAEAAAKALKAQGLSPGLADMLAALAKKKAEAEDAQQFVLDQ
jgi:hypothetical protein